MALPRGRDAIIAAAIVTLALVVAGEVAGAVVVANDTSVSDKAAIDGLAIAVGALALALLGAALALTTYIVYTGSPALVLEIRMPGQAAVHACETAALTVRVDPPKAGSAVVRVSRLSGDGAFIRLVLRNTSRRYTAKNPVASLEFTNLLSVEAQPGWERVSPRAGGTVALWWDGGADRSIATTSARPLPLVVLSHAAIMTGPCELVVGLSADGFRAGPFRMQINRDPSY